MRPHYGADTIKRGFIGEGILFKRGVHGVFKGLSAARDADHLRAQKAHFLHVDKLFFYVRLSHKNAAFQA